MFKLASLMACLLVGSAAVPVYADQAAPAVAGAKDPQTSTPSDKVTAAPESEPAQKLAPVEKATRSDVGTVLTSESPMVPAEPRRVQMRLSGSTCVACLHELQLKIGRIDGVTKVKIDFPADNMYEYYALPSAATAAATIVYDARRTNLENIKALLRTQGYHPYKVVDKPGS